MATLFAIYGNCARHPRLDLRRDFEMVPTFTKCPKDEASARPKGSSGCNPIRRSLDSAGPCVAAPSSGRTKGLAKARRKGGSKVN